MVVDDATIMGAGTVEGVGVADMASGGLGSTKEHEDGEGGSVLGCGCGVEGAKYGGRRPQSTGMFQRAFHLSLALLGGLHAPCVWG